jgi:hypothetical protein
VDEQTAMFCVTFLQTLMELSLLYKKSQRKIKKKATRKTRKEKIHLFVCECI